MGKRIRFWTAAATGALLQYFYDPQAGQVRRALVREQVGDRVDQARVALTRKTTEPKAIGSLRLLTVGRFQSRFLREMGLNGLQERRQAFR